MENSAECKTDHTATATNQNYVSCIKIHGLEILPPILTDEKRKCMQYYRDLAIQVEEKIKNRKCQRIHDDSTESEHSAACNDSEVSSISDSVVYSSDKSSNDEPTFRSVAFTDSCRSDVLHMLNDSQNKLTESEHVEQAVVETPLLDKSAIKNVPLNSSIDIDVNDVESDTQKCFEVDTLTNCNETLVTQDSLKSDLNKLIDEHIANCKTSDLTENESKINNNISEISTNNDGASTNEDVTITDESLGDKTPIIRRNSYILENPSPYLLALINQNGAECSSDKPSSNSGQHKRRRWNLEKAREKWSSIEQDLNHAVRKNSLKRSELHFNSLPTSTVTSPETKMFDSSILTLPNITSKTQLPEKESDIPTNDNPRHLSNIKSVHNVRENITNGTDKSDTPSRFIRSYATPLRKSIQPKRIDNKFTSPVKTQSPEKSKKILDNTIQTKKTDLGKNNLIRQRRLSFDELKRSTATKINNVVHKANNLVTRSPEKPTKPLRTSPVKSVKPLNVPKKIIPEQQIREMITDISLQQSNQMTMLLNKQRTEQEQLMKLFAEQQAHLLSKLRCTYQNTIETNINQTESVIETTNKLEIEKALNTAVVTEDITSSEKTLMECRKMLDFESSYAESSQSRSSPEDSLKTISPPASNQISTRQQYLYHTDFNRNSKQSDLQIIDLEVSTRNDANTFLSDTFCPATTSSSKYTGSTDSLEITTVKALEKKRSLNRLITTCSRQLFPTEKQIWAATKLCAATRGFLVRRLIKTERVQNLVKTIRDSLLCAMELHHEKADNIQPADVELHRRLIQQVTAACYAFHDTFFDLSMSEQLSIIAFDRERQKEKQLRPASSKSNTSLSSTTQKVLERKLKRRSSDSISGNQSRCSSSRSSYNVGDFRPRTKSLGMQEPPENNNIKKVSPPNDVITNRAMSYGANKKPWR